MLEDLNPEFKIIVVGNGMVGKTTLTVKFAKDKFTTEYKKTLGVDFLLREKYIKKIDKEVKFYIWDTAGQDDLFALAKRYFRGADGALVVFSVNDRNSFDSVRNWHNLVLEERQDIPMGLVMSKIDLSNEMKVNEEEAIKLAEELGMKFFKVSSKNGINVNECFEYLAVEHFKRNGYNSSGADCIEDIQRIAKEDEERNKNLSGNNKKFKFKNSNDDDIKEIPSDKDIKNSNKSKNKNYNRSNNSNNNYGKNEKITGFKLGTKDLEKQKKKGNCC